MSSCVAKRPARSERAIEHRRERPRAAGFADGRGRLPRRGRVIDARPDVVGSTIVILMAFNFGGLFFLPSSIRDSFLTSDDLTMLAAAAVQSLLATALWIAVNRGLNYCHSARPHLANCN
jgi:hypothetical protein